MMWVFWVAAALVVFFVVIMPVFFGPPYLPALRSNLNTALDLLDLKPGQTLLDLGCGDGRVLRAAAERGWKAVGIEISPALVIVARLRTWRYRDRVRVIWGGYFSTTWPRADGIFAFMIGHHMPRLGRRVEAWRGGRPVRLASVAFEIPGKKPATTKNGVFLYEYK